VQLRALSVLSAEMSVIDYSVLTVITYNVVYEQSEEWLRVILVQFETLPQNVL